MKKKTIPSISRLSPIVLLILTLLSFFIDDYLRNLPRINGLFIFSIYFIILVLYILPMFLVYYKNKRWIIPMVISLLMTTVIVALLKSAIARPRPNGIELLNFYGIIDYSFPSLHTAIAFSVIPILIIFFPRAKWLIYGYGISIGLSRIFLGVHYLSDVFSGALIGLSIGLLTVKSMDSDKEFRRKAFHLFLGIFIVFSLYFNLLNTWILILILFAGIIISIKYSKNLIIRFLLKNFERDEDIKRFPGRGIIFYFIGSIIVLLLFDRNIALASIIILALGDSLSHLIGKYGRIKHPFTDKKYLEGTFIGIFAAFLGAMLFVDYISAFLASLVAMIVEGIDLKIGLNKIDDNITVPLTAGIVIWALAFI